MAHSAAHRDNGQPVLKIRPTLAHGELTTAEQTYSGPRPTNPKPHGDWTPNGSPSLFLLGLLTGFAVPALKNPRLALSSHLEAVLNGMFLVLLGLLWPHLQLPNAWGVTAVALIIGSGWCAP